MRHSNVLIILGLLASSACFHANISTGATPSTVVVEKSFASSWIYGLVPPSTVETAAKCPNGVAKVETQLSFVNQLVGVLTLGIYTPMSIKVTCALNMASTGPASPTDITVSMDTGSERVREAFSRAADQVVLDGKAAFVQVQR